jgi:hypothetical protein
MVYRTQGIEKRRMKRLKQLNDDLVDEVRTLRRERAIYLRG